MGRFLCGFLLPMLLLIAALLSWSLISLVDLLAFLFIQYTAPKIGSRCQRKFLVTWCAFIFSLLVILSHVVFHAVFAIKGDHWSSNDAHWARLIGFLCVHSWMSPSTMYFLVIQVLAACVALIEIYGGVFGLDSWGNSCFGRLDTSAMLIGSHVRVLCCLLLAALQLVVGISNPSWVSLPFFICSSIGLVDWSLTSNFLGLFRWWRHLQLYAGLNIVLLYVCQLPIEYSEKLLWFADFIGLFRLSAKSAWTEICSAVSLLLFYVMLSRIRRDLQEMDYIVSTGESNLTEQLLPKKHSFFIRESRSGLRHTNVLLRRDVFQTFSINFFTYGFLISLLALSFWSFHFASLCAFGLLAYVGYIVYAFPPMFHLHRLNGLLLVFILFWAASTYVFNVAFTVLNKELDKDMEIWETIGLWHYSIPGLYLLAQFGLGVLIAMGNLVNDSVFSYLSDGEGPSTNECSTEEGRKETIVFIVATIAWGLRKTSRAVVLAHFALLYILQLNVISKALEQKGSFLVEILSALGLPKQNSGGEFLPISLLVCFCSIHNHGFDVLFSFSAVVQRAPCPPIGFSILRDGLIKSVLLSVYSLISRDNHQINSSYERRIASYLSAMGQKFLSAYRSWGTYIALSTILLTVYLVIPNYTSFGHLFFVLLWLIGRQILGTTRWQLWFPLKVYAVIILVFIYSISVFISFQTWLSSMVDLDSAFGYNKEASILKNIWESLAILVVMQLYSYERSHNNNFTAYDCDAQETKPLSFIKRILIWHSEKILSLSLFYASLSPVSTFGVVYLLGLVISSMLPKTSRIPSTLFLLYSGLISMAEYLFQMWGDQAEMFPGQKHSHLSMFLGLQLYRPGFFGIESGLRSKVLVIAACVLRYNVFHWLETMPCDDGNRGKWDEPCTLFALTEGAPSETESKPTSGTWSSLNSALFQQPSVVSTEKGPSDGINTSTSLYNYFWESSKESRKWNRRRILSLRKERLDMQKTSLKIYMKFWIENMFNLFGLEINMIVLLLASFTVLNAISLLYIASLAACVLLNRHIIKKLWPVFVFLSASIVTIEYLALWLNLVVGKQPVMSEEARVPCHDCWRTSEVYFDFCRKCWLGSIVDDPRMLISYYAVFMFSCFKLRSDRLSSPYGSQTYRQLIYDCYKASVLSDLSFETKGLWTFLDYLRLYSYCHLLDLVLVLILITGTLEYDILHLGYLGFALVFSRMRLEILKKKNEIFKFLRMYNFALIVLSLAYQSPFIGDATEGKCDTTDYISEVIGFYKYDYGFRITSRSALVEIIIFMLVSLQSYMFSSKEFDYVSKYLEAEQIGAIVREQERRAAWKTAHLQHIRKSEEQKCLRNLQVENMKSEMLNLKIQLDSMSTTANCGNNSPESGRIIIRGTKSSLDAHRENGILDNGENELKRENHSLSSDAMSDFDTIESPASERNESSLLVESPKHMMDTLHEITELKLKAANSNFVDLERRGREKLKKRENPIISAVHLIGDGVCQVQSLGNLAVHNLINFLNIEPKGQDSDEHSSEDEVYYETETQNIGGEQAEQTASVVQLSSDRIMSDVTYSQIGTILRYMWAKMRSNNDVVCYCCFVIMFLWNFSILSMLYLIALFLYALCINTGPSYIFWVVMLIYTEICILLQYLYQIIIQHCGFTISASLLQELGFPAHKTMSSFVTSNWPLFLVYLFTLLQTTITTRNGDWANMVTEFSFSKRKNHLQQDLVKSHSFRERIQRLFLPMRNFSKQFIRRLYRYWKSVTEGAETPPYFVQLSMEVTLWPDDSIQPERIESGINRLLKILHDKRCKEKNMNQFHSPSRVRVQSIERSPENSDVALVVFEVVHASPSSESSPAPAEWYTSLTPAADVAGEILKAQRDGILNEIRFPYPILSVIGGGKREVDLYAYTFCADLAVFFLVAVFYQSVIKNNTEFLEVYQLEDQFPKEFVFILMVIFFLIVLDRIIYLRSFATGKVIFYLSNFVLFTYSITRYAWNMEPSHRYAGRLALRAVYLTKAISLALQAIQIRFGMPHKSALYRQFLTSSISHINFLGFRVYRALPFLYELRCVLDWSCTTTSLTMYDWLKLEDIHGSLFLVKCDVDLNRTSHQQGKKQTKLTKFCNGICLFWVLICVIWAPMLMYSSGNPTNIANPIKDASVRIEIKTISGKLTLFETTLCEKISWNELNSRTKLDTHGYLSTYNEQDVQLLCCQADASSLWLVPPVVQARYMNSLQRSMDIAFSWQFTRDRPKGKEVVKYELTVQDQDLPKSSEVREVLNGTANSFTIHNLYPRYFRVTGSGEVRFLENAVDLVSGKLVLNRGNPEWWSFHDIDASDVGGCGELAGPLAIVVSEETPQGILGETLSKFSIWGLYITFVLAVGRFIRLQCSDLRMRIPFENLPFCDRLLAICEDMYAARAEGELEVEEVLYWTLIKIYRSPHMLLEYTKLD
ncbi:Piezo family [Trema orientale]|uniref:Piezo family n=1 Tax=Trema orientale TaxID=63057 RepID=A0A2P5EIX9_TREOI|nr:Piezo family [Trema orientale]